MAVVLLLMMMTMVVVVVTVITLQESAVFGVSEGGLAAFGRWHIVAAE
jgi:hypothetical protein